MLRYYYVEQKDRLYVYDYESGFYKSFDGEDGKWVTPVVSFSQVESDNDIDFVEISEEAAKEISNGVSFDEELKAYLSVIGNKMKIAVINGTEKHGVTYKLKEIFLEPFKRDAKITEYYLPKDCPSFCVGCTSCFMKGEDTCKDYPYVSAIEKSLLEADLIVMTSPSYVMHATGAMKALLDHFGYRWMPHRPAPEMFSKRAVIITQCLGAGAKSTAKDIKHSLSWWGISKIGVFSGALMGDIVWDKLPNKKRKQLTNKVKRFARKFAKINYKKPAHTKLVTKIKFAFCRMIQKKVQKSGSGGLDCKYWQEHGWLDKNRPWKRDSLDKR